MSNLDEKLANTFDQLREERDIYHDQYLDTQEELRAALAENEDLRAEVERLGASIERGSKPLDAFMDNVLASRLGDVARNAMSSDQKAGDSIDRGLILRRLLDEAGFKLFTKGLGK